MRKLTNIAIFLTIQYGKVVCTTILRFDTLHVKEKCYVL